MQLQTGATNLKQVRIALFPYTLHTIFFVTNLRNIPLSIHVEHTERGWSKNYSRVDKVIIV